MIIEFSIKNFCSFKEKTTFSMKASSDKIHNENILVIGNERLLKTAAIYGANASGKTNLLKTISMVSNVIRFSNNYSIDSKLPIVPFMFDDNTINGPSEFEIKFIVDNIRYEYSFIADSSRIYEESLNYYPNGRISNIFKRVKDKPYNFNSKDKNLALLKMIENATPENKFFLSTATNFNYDKTRVAYDFIANKIGVIADPNHLQGYSFEQYSKNEGNLKNFALNFLKKADFTINDYDIVKEKLNKEQKMLLPLEIKNLIPEDVPFYSAKTKHKHYDKEYKLNIEEESAGTQAIFTLIPILKDVFDNKKVLFFDELDRSLHPELLKLLVNMFHSPKINKNGAQLIFNTHDTNLLNLEIFRRDQIWFTEKCRDSGQTILYPLDDYKVRKDENIEKGYIMGVFGAIPFIETDIDLL